MVTMAQERRATCATEANDVSSRSFRLIGTQAWQHNQAQHRKFWLGGAAHPPIFGRGGKAPPDPPLNGRSSHLIEAAKRGRLDQMIFFSAPLTTRAPPTTVRPGT